MASEVGVSDGLPASAKASWILILIVHGMLAFLLNIANFNAVKEGGPLMMNVVGNVKQVVMIFLSVFLFGNRMTVMGIIGSVICILGSMWYTYGLYRKSGL
jgi:singapore isolate B (sub-type 7) whole genome shotgun sequence assembly, scaffold_28